MIWKLGLIALVELFGFILAAYRFWRKLKEDFPPEGIFSLTLIISLLGLFLGRVVFILSNLEKFGFGYLSGIFSLDFPGISIPGGFLAGMLGLNLYSWRRRWDTWLIADAALNFFLIVMGTITLASLIRNFSYPVLGVLILVVLVVLVAEKIWKRYRSFSWYKSGRVGFLACFSTVAFFGPFLLLDIFWNKALYFEEYLNLLVITLAIILLYRRSGRDFKEDRGNFFSILRKLKNDKSD